jgi:peptidoglycan hydrolase-like protein with peptidoglycan-binding domain
MALTAARFKNNSQLQAAATNAPALRTGARGDGVGALQVALRDLGFAMPDSFKSVFPDGIYGAETTAAVKQFQQGKGLSADGIAGHNTLAALDERFRQESKGASPPFPQPDLSGIVSPPPPVPPPDVPPTPLAQPGSAKVQPFQPRVKLASPTPAPSAAAPLSAPAAAPGVAASVVLPVLIGRRAINNCGDPAYDDFRANDHPTPRLKYGIQEICLSYLRSLPPAKLEELWRWTFANVYHTGSLGQGMITRFLAGTGGTVIHPVGSTLSNVAQSTVTFQMANQAVKAEIDRQFAAQYAATMDVDVSKLSITVNIPFATFSPDVTIPPMFRAMIGGIHGIELYVTSFTRTSLITYAMTLLYRICDNFGVGNDDLYTPDLQAMWILQHETAGPMPFVNSIEIEQAIAGRFVVI